MLLMMMMMMMMMMFLIGLTTTPQLHYIVRCHNSGGEYGEPSLDGYYEKLAASCMHLHYYSDHAGPIELKVCR